MVTDVDAIDYLGALAQLSVDLLDVAANGVLLADHRQALRLAASSEWPRVTELSEPQNDSPGLDAFHGGSLVCSPDLATEDRWPTFTAAARAAGFGAVHAFPMRWHDRTIGAMNLFSVQPGKLDVEAAELGQTLADVATIGVLNERARNSAVVIEQLERALQSRITIEQAKGVLAERLRVTVDDAFTVLRGYARRNNLKLAGVARAVARGELRVTSPDDGRATPSAESGQGHPLKPCVAE
ncbi:ANTAR domain-containing protein [Kutzneria sp. 744]|nr:ANTAR domain-containing protein [Kutzneria sp. 744]